MLGKLEAYTGCKFVPSNTTKEMPAYPFVSFTLINIEQKKGTYSETTAEIGGKLARVLYMPVFLKYSFTVQSKDEAEALHIALMISDFFTEAHRLSLEDNDIVVSSVGNITPRDNLLTIDYEYRKGLDVTLCLNNVISDPATETIEKVTINEMTLEKEQ